VTRSMKSATRTADRRVESSDKPSISKFKGWACLSLKSKEDSQPAEVRVTRKKEEGKRNIKYLESVGFNNYLVNPRQRAVHQGRLPLMDTGSIQQPVSAATVQ